MIRIGPAAPTPLWMKVTLRDTTAAEREAAILPFIPDHAEVGLSVARSVGVNLVIITVPEGESIDSGNGPQLTVQRRPRAMQGSQRAGQPETAFS